MNIATPWRCIVDENEFRLILTMMKHDHVLSKSDIKEVRVAIERISSAIELYDRINHNNSEGALMQEGVAATFISVVVREFMENEIFMKVIPKSGEPGF